MNEEINIEELSKMVKEYMEKSFTIEEVLNAKKEERELCNKSFEDVWKSYEIVNKTRKKQDLLFKKAAVKLYFSAIITDLFRVFSRNDAAVEIYMLFENICSKIDSLNSEKELLKLIKASLIELEKYGAYECNYDIAVLLSMLNEKNHLLYEIVLEDTNSLAIRLRGISYMTNNNYRNELKELDDSIFKKTKELKLEKSY